MKNKPMYLDSGAIHTTVCAGYDNSNSYVRIIDPWKNTATTYYDYRKICKGIRLKTGTGKSMYMVTY